MKCLGDREFRDVRWEWWKQVAVKVGGGIPAAGRSRSAAARFRGAPAAEADAAEGSGTLKAGKGYCNF